MTVNFYPACLKNVVSRELTESEKVQLEGFRLEQEARRAKNAEIEALLISLL